MTILRKKTMAIFASFVLALALAAPAAMAQSSQKGYIQEGPSVLDEADNGNGGDDSGDKGDVAAGGGSGGSGPVDTQEAATSQLPFTGADLGLMAAAGGSLVLLGFGMRRLTRTPDAT